MTNQPNKPAVNRGSDGKFLPGNNANPKGRPTKDYSLTSLLKEELDKVPHGEKHGRTWRELLILAWLTGAMKNPILLKELLDRVEGKITQPIGGETGQPIDIRVTYDNGSKAQI